MNAPSSLSPTAAGEIPATLKHLPTSGAQQDVGMRRQSVWDMSDDPCYFCAMGDLARTRLEGNVA